MSQNENNAQQTQAPSPTTTVETDKRNCSGICATCPNCSPKKNK